MGLFYEKLKQYARRLGEYFERLVQLIISYELPPSLFWLNWLYAAY